MLKRKRALLGRRIAILPERSLEIDPPPPVCWVKSSGSLESGFYFHRLRQARARMELESASRYRLELAVECQHLAKCTATVAPSARQLMSCRSAVADWWERPRLCIFSCSAPAACADCRCGARFIFEVDRHGRETAKFWWSFSLFVALYSIHCRDPH